MFLGNQKNSHEDAATFLSKEDVGRTVYVILQTSEKSGSGKGDLLRWENKGPGREREKWHSLGLSLRKKLGKERDPCYSRFGDVRESRGGFQKKPVARRIQGREGGGVGYL